MYGYIYKTTNKINGKIYVGQKRSPVFLGEKYLGSGLILNNAIHKYGKHNFKTECIEECDSQEQLNDREIFWIKQLDAQNLDIRYNIGPGGQGGHTSFNLNLRWYNNGVKEILVSTEDSIPEGYVKGRLNFNGRFDYSSGHIWINNGVTQIAIDPSELDKYEGFVVGMLDRREQWRSNVGKYVRTEEILQKFRASKKQYFEEHPDKRINSGCFKCGQRSHNKGKISITDGVKNKYIDSRLLDTWIKQGWYRGSTQNIK